MNNRQKFLFNIMILLILTAVPWFYLIESQIVEIDMKKIELNKIEEDMINISSIPVPSDSILNIIIKKYSAKLEGNKVKVKGINNSSNIIRSLENNMFMIERVVWKNGTASIYFKR